jgi:hypothetical protein
MSDEITEALLEMHFHEALWKYFAKKIKKKFVKLYKPSARREVWLGFDQAWVRTVLSIDNFIDQLQGSIQENQPSPKFFIGYFLQFKRVEIINNNRNIIPIFSSPYYRSKLSLNVNKRTGISQHETLLKLSNLPKANVYYVCPMVFNYDEILEEPDINKLRFVDIRSAPSGWNTNSQHYIAFQRLDDLESYWFSKPETSKCLNIDQWSENNVGITTLNHYEVIDYIQKLSHQISEIFTHKEQLRLTDEYLENKYYLPECWSIMEFE